MYKHVNCTIITVGKQSYIGIGFLNTTEINLLLILLDCHKVLLIITRTIKKITKKYIVKEKGN